MRSGFTARSALRQQATFPAQEGAKVYPLLGGTITVTSGSFGGEGYDVSGNIGYLNDLWEYKSNLSSTAYTIGGTVSGLAGTGLVLQDNGGNNLALSANGAFTFGNSVSSGTTYAVTVLTQPQVRHAL